MKKKRKKTLYIILLSLAIFLVVGLDPRLETTEYIYESTEVPASFDEFKICHISDLHCKSFGKDNQTLLQSIEEMQPDIVVLTGDIVDENHSDLSSIENLFRGLENLNLPAYYVTGNHELKEESSYQYAQLLSLMETYSVTDLDDKTEEITQGEESIYLTGSKWYSRYIVNYLQPVQPQGFHILLYHGTDFFDLISGYNYDLLLSGHVHGGIIRIPFLDIGLLDNSGNFFPEYTSGAYQSDSGFCTMIASRGLGDSRVPRFYNRPELVLITLRSIQP